MTSLSYKKSFKPWTVSVVFLFSSCLAAPSFTSFVHISTISPLHMTFSTFPFLLCQTAQPEPDMPVSTPVHLGPSPENTQHFELSQPQLHLLCFRQCHYLQNIHHCRSYSCLVNPPFHFAVFSQKSLLTLFSTHSTQPVPSFSPLLFTVCCFQWLTPGI